MIEESAIKKELEVSVSIDPEVERIPADERALKQILVNLLNNAVKFTPEKGKIELTVKGDRNLNTIRFTVQDTGIGISEEDSRKLFKPFVQLDSSLTKKYAGTGLGLSLVFRLAELQGGYVEMESEVGKGSRFMVLFPWHQTDME
jgi:signal transduction histidine kinase